MNSSAFGSGARSVMVALCLVFVSARPATAQAGGAGSEVLTNESVTQMVNGKVPKDLILTKIRTTKGSYDLTPSGVISLHANKVADDVVKAMIQTLPSNGPKESLNNDAVIQMVNGMVSKDIILMKIQGTKADYDLTTNGIISLNQNKVSQDVVKAMMAASSSTPTTAPRKP